MSEDLVAKNESIQRIQHLYFNGFELTSTLSDMGCLLMVDGQPTAKIAMSFTTAKTLFKALESAMDVLERATGKQMLTIDEVSAGYSRLNPESVTGNA